MENQRINEHILKITGTASLLSPLEQSKSYRIGADIDVKSITESDNDDGTYDLTYRAKLITCELLKDNGDVLRAGVKGSQSAKLRRQIYAWGQDAHPEIDDEELYEIIMNGIRANGDAIFTRIIQKHENNIT